MRFKENSYVKQVIWKLDNMKNTYQKEREFIDKYEPPEGDEVLKEYKERKIKECNIIEKELSLVKNRLKKLLYSNEKNNGNS